MNAANVSVLVHGGRLMALWEGGSALEVDPGTLDAGGLVAWRPDLAGAPFSAHPKVEPDGTLWNIGYVPAPRPLLLFYRIGRSGRLEKAGAMPISPLGMVHDFVVTKRSLVVLLPPFVLDRERFAAGRTSFLDAHAWRPGLGVRAIVVDKDSLRPTRRHELPPGFHFHHGNGFEEPDGTIRLDLCQAPDPGFLVRDLRDVMRGAWRFDSPPPAYRQAVLRPGGGAEISASLPGTAEFPRVDPRRTGRRHRRVFMLAGDGEGPGWPLRRIVALDADGGAARGWRYPRRRIPEEHVFVPRGGGEDDGWLVGPFLDVGARATGLSVFEAGRIEDGPVWQGLLPYPVPLGLHGAFAAA